MTSTQTSHQRQTKRPCNLPRTEIGPQPGPQKSFLETKADIAIYGGAAGGGKTAALLLESTRHTLRPGFGCVIFRRTSVQITKPGGLWDESQKFFRTIKGEPIAYRFKWTFPSGAVVQFGHLEREETKHDWQGSQICLIGFDELTHFTEGQFWYMMSRNRSNCGVRPYLRATCNPDPDSFVAKLIQWWIGDDGFPIPERSGVLRWFSRQGDELVWDDSKEALIDRYGPDASPKSLTFIGALVTDNAILMRRDPGYVANLRSLATVDRARLLGGNWKVRPAAGDYFKSSSFGIIPVAPSCRRVIRYWDRAATVPTPENPDPDWTVGVKVGATTDGRFIVHHVERFRARAAEVLSRIRAVSAQDGRDCTVVIEQDPGSAGVAEGAMYVRELAGFDVRLRTVQKNKETRAKPASAQAEAGNVSCVDGRWVPVFLSELENFPGGGHDDQVDAFSGAINELTSGVSRILVG